MERGEQEAALIHVRRHQSVTISPDSLRRSSRQSFSPQNLFFYLCGLKSYKETRGALPIVRLAAGARRKADAWLL